MDDRDDFFSASPAYPAGRGNFRRPGPDCTTLRPWLMTKGPVGVELASAHIVSIAANNCGEWSYYHFSKKHDVDQGTTGKDYSRDVLAHPKLFEEMLKNDAKNPAKPASPAKPAPNTPMT